MFTYFHGHKLKYNKGQMAPFFIAVLVIIIIMGMVTVNLSKVALTKTESSNAADAGALAAGAVMATVFNSVAKANAQMEVDYQMFMATVSVMFALATVILAHSLITACPLSCEAAVGMSLVPMTIKAIGISTFAFGIGQALFYQTIRDIAKKGRESGIKIGHEFVFINSGIGVKLKEGAQRDGFRDFINNQVDSAPTYAYSWQDGQGRQHNVTSYVGIDKVDTFDMQVAVLPSLAESALILLSGLMATWAVPNLASACVWELCCFGFPVCCPPHETMCILSAIQIGAALVALTAAWAGLMPGTVISDDGSLLNSLMWNYCWIDDIDHNRLVQVETTQHHEGTDLGLWQTQYPDTKSSSEVNFQGSVGGGEGGSIYPPRLRHDASITRIDFK